MIEIQAIGGYNDVGKNCTAVTIDDEIIIVDLGIHLEYYAKLTEEEDLVKFSPEALIQAGAIPDITPLMHKKDKVKAIVLGHAHLDHIGAVPFLARSFNVPIYGTPFTLEVIRAMLKDDDIKLRNELIAIKPNHRLKITDKIILELIHITHSTPETALVALHCPYGAVLYANDFKLDPNPILGPPPNYKRMEEVAKENVVALVVESTYADIATKTPSEGVAREMLKEVMLNAKNRNNLVIVTTFSSHIARLKSIIEMGRKMNRKILFLGRSLSKYMYAAKKAGVIDLTKDVEMVRYSRQIEKRLKKIDHQRNNYVLVVTGHQGEPKSVLYKIAKKDIKFRLYHDDNVIFSCRTIPTPTNIKNREDLEQELKSQGVRIFKDIHQSGHAAREDLREFIQILKPRHIIPAHGNKEMKEALASLAKEMGYEDKYVHLIKDKEKVQVQ